MILIRAALFISIFLAVPVFNFGQQPRKERAQELESRLFKLPEALFKLEVELFGRGYEFCNTSPMRIVKFRLGCVEKKDDELNIMSARPFVDIDLGPASYDTNECRYWKLEDRL